LSADKDYKTGSQIKISSALIRERKNLLQVNVHYFNLLNSRYNLLDDSRLLSNIDFAATMSKVAHREGGGGGGGGRGQFALGPQLSGQPT
jgi:hypothetical protein